MSDDQDMKELRKYWITHDEPVGKLMRYDHEAVGQLDNAHCNLWAQVELLEEQHARLTTELEQAEGACAAMREVFEGLLQDEAMMAGCASISLSHNWRNRISRLLKRSPGKAYADRLAAAEAVVNKYPKTRDGVPIVVGMRLFWDSNNPDTMKKGVVVAELLQWKDGWDAYWYDSEEERNYAMPADFGLYSTKAAGDFDQTEQETKC